MQPRASNPVVYKPTSLLQNSVQPGRLQYPERENPANPERQARGPGHAASAHAQGVGRRGRLSGDEPGSSGARPSAPRPVLFGVLGTLALRRENPGLDAPARSPARTAAMSSNSFAYNEQPGGGEAAELGQEATSTISPSGAFGLFSSDWKK